jgi:hypothetical protein
MARLPPHFGSGFETSHVTHYENRKLKLGSFAVTTIEYGGTFL